MSQDSDRDESPRLAKLASGHQDGAERGVSERTVSEIWRDVEERVKTKNGQSSTQQKRQPRT